MVGDAVSTRGLQVSFEGACLGVWSVQVAARHASEAHLCGPLDE